MPTIRLVPSAYSVSSSNRVTVTSPANMYYDTDHTANYCSIRGRNSTSSTYYAFISGFNFDDVPSNANVTSFTVKIRCYRNTYLSTGSSYRLRLASSASSSSALTGTTMSSDIGTTVDTYTIPTGSYTWSQISGYGSNFCIEVPLRASSNQYPYLYVYGAEIEVTYSLSNPRTITSTLSGSGTIDPSGATTSYDGEEYTLTITPTNTADTITVTNNNNDVTSELEAHYSGGTATSYSTASGTGVTTGFARSGGAFYQSSSTSSDSWLRYAIGYTAENPYSTSNTSNTYCKDGTNDATTQGWMNYPFDFSDLPNDAEVTSVEVKCYGATESTTETARHADVSLWCGNEQKGTTQSFTSTSNSTITINDPGEWTREELQDAWVRFGVGYYGGRILGITWKVNYTYGGTLHHYTYTYNVSGNATIAVTIGSSASVSVTGVSLSQNTASIDVGSTVQLTATIAPSNATDKAVTWSTNNGNVTVNNGLVTGVSVGTSIVTVTTHDGSYTATCTVTVTAAVLTDYILTNTLQPGREYLIVNGNSGSVYMMSNESGGSRTLKGVAATVSNNKISINGATAAKVVFSCELYDSNNSITTTLINNNQYIYSDSSTGLRMYTSASMNRFWHYEDNKFWLFKSTSTNGYTDTSSEYKYYLEWDNSGNFTDNHLTSPSVQDTTIPTIYLFVKDDGTVEPTLSFKSGSTTWTTVIKVWVKTGASTWTQQSSVSNVFDSTTNYIKGN